METEILAMDAVSEAVILEKTKTILLRGGLVAFPTETVYGLGGDARNPLAAKKIYAAKGRPSDNPLIVHIGDFSQLPELVTGIPENGKKLMDAFWPGPLTLIFQKSDCIPRETTGGLSTIAVRMPSHPGTHRLLKELQIPVAAPSANLSGRPSTTKASHVIEDLSGRIDLILSDRESEIGVESTIVDVTGPVPTLLRPGFITQRMLEDVVGNVNVDPAITKDSIIHHRVIPGGPKAPGMKYRHYAPKAPMTVFYGDTEAVLMRIRFLADAKTGILTSDEHISSFPVGKVISLGNREDKDQMAHNLFDALRTFDSLGVTKIYSEDFSGTGISEAIMNRLLKAAGGSYEKVEE